MRTGKLLLLNAALLAGMGANLYFSHGVKPLARSKPCEGCKKPGPKHIQVTLSCGQNKTARAVPKNVSAEASALAPTRNSVEWEAKSGWTVKFEGKSPCQHGTFNAKEGPCKVQGAAAGKYSYEITLDGCAKPGKAVLTVK
jgi:hypothetical protein